MAAMSRQKTVIGLQFSFNNRRQGIWSVHGIVIAMVSINAVRKGIVQYYVT